MFGNKYDTLMLKKSLNAQLLPKTSHLKDETSYNLIPKLIQFHQYNIIDLSV